jgi:hypothetical protein
VRKTDLNNNQYKYKSQRDELPEEAGCDAGSCHGHGSSVRTGWCAVYFAVDKHVTMRLKRVAGVEEIQCQVAVFIEQFLE